MQKPHALVLDTNILINLMDPAQRVEIETYNHFFSHLVAGNNKLVMPEKVAQEWERHRHTKYEQFLKGIMKPVRDDGFLLDFLKGTDKAQLHESMNYVRKMQKRQYTYSYGLRARKVNSFIEGKGVTIPSRSPLVDKLIADFIDEMKLPFFAKGETRGDSKAKDKYQTSDAFIFFSVYEFALQAKDDYEYVAFVTENKNDFSDESNATLIHQNLAPFAEEANIRYFNGIKRYLREIDPDKRINHADIYQSEDMGEFLSDGYFEPCRNEECDEEVHINSDSYKDYGEGTNMLYYYLKCPHCGHFWNTGDSPMDPY